MSSDASGVWSSDEFAGHACWIRSDLTSTGSPSTRSKSKDLPSFLGGKEKDLGQGLLSQQCNTRI
jgi:hypothetical protein